MRHTQAEGAAGVLSGYDPAAPGINSLRGFCTFWDRAARGAQLASAFHG